MSGVTLAYPSVLSRDLWITIAPPLNGIPLSSERFGLGTTPVAQAAATLTVAGVPAGGWIYRISSSSTTRAAPPLAGTPAGAIVYGFW